MKKTAIKVFCNIAMPIYFSVTCIALFILGTSFLLIGTIDKGLNRINAPVRIITWLSRRITKIADWFFMTLDFVRSVICDWEKRKTLTDL